MHDKGVHCTKTPMMCIGTDWQHATGGTPWSPRLDSKRMGTRTYSNQCACHAHCLRRFVSYQC